MTIRLSTKLSARVSRIAKKKKVSRSEVVRQGIEALEASETSAYDAWRDAIGIARGGPTDLATNAKHLTGYGR